MMTHFGLSLTVRNHSLCVANPKQEVNNLLGMMLSQCHEEGALTEEELIEEAIMFYGVSWCPYFPSSQLAALALSLL